MTAAQTATEHLLELFELGENEAFAVAIIGGKEHTAGPTDLAFEIGSVGKTFTATTLAALAADGTVALDDPIGRWLDAGPAGAITLEQLATHTSGLPRLAPNHASVHVEDDPYSAYGADLAEAALRTLHLRPGREEYSNYGFQLLGICLERAAGQPFTDLVAERVFEPLGMRGAGPNGTSPHPATGSAPAWHGPLAGPGLFETTADDVLAYLHAVLDPPPSPAGQAVRAVTRKRPLAWVRAADSLLWHNGGTGGFRSMVAVDRARHRAVAAIVADATVDPDEAVAHAALGGDPLELRR